MHRSHLGPLRRAVPRHRLCRRLVNEGHEVVAVDNFFTSQKTNVKDLLDKPNFEIIRHDITKEFFIEVDQIYNMACPASPVHYQYNPVKTMKTSVIGTMNMLGLAKRVKARILQASTSEVYGDPEISPQTEEYWGHVNCNGVRSCYDEGKRAAETLFFDYHRRNGVNIRVGRIFNTYGPRMHPFDGRVVSNFIRQALAGDDITVFGDGSQSRSFCFVDDLIDAFLAHMGARLLRPNGTGFWTTYEDDDTRNRMADLSLSIIRAGGNDSAPGQPVTGAALATLIG